MKTKVCTNPECFSKGEPQPLSEFYKRPDKGADYYRPRCKACLKIENAAREKLRFEQYRETDRKYREAHREELRIKSHKYFEAYRGQSRENGRKWRKLHPERVRELKRKYREADPTIGHRRRQALKIAVLEAYGGPVCACCGEMDMRFLTIDHVNNDGAQHKKVIGKGSLYAWLKKNGYPEGFQVLCWNCNCGRHHNGGICPHKDPR